VGEDPIPTAEPKGGTGAVAVVAARRPRPKLSAGRRFESSTGTVVASLVIAPQNFGRSWRIATLMWLSFKKLNLSGKFLAITSSTSPGREADS
jgi:hypothetical protein